MIDLSGLPLPANAPEPGACVRVQRPRNDLARIVLDPPHREHTVLDFCLLRDLEAALLQLEKDRGVRGIVIIGRAPLHFAFGADIDVIEAVQDQELVQRAILAAHSVFDLLANMRARTVAAVGGAVPGGACELSLACDLIVLADHPSTRIGLPETKLGIIPGWGGSHRLPRRIGVMQALDAILQGRLYDARRALRMGFVDRITAPEYLERVADALALDQDRGARKRKGRLLARLFIDKNPAATALIASQARKRVMALTGGHYPAALEAIELVAHGARRSMRGAGKREALACAKLAVGPVCKGLLSLFRASEAAKKLGKLPDGSKPAPFKQAGVIGAGVMGAGIASTLAEKGVATRLADLSDEALDAALLEHRKEIEKKRKRRRLERHLAEQAMDRLDLCRGKLVHPGADIVIEAVAEKLDIKHAVFRELAEQLGPDAVLATNTSSLSVDDIAAGLPHPERVVGLHFFNPVRRMPLVEVVRGTKTSDEVVTRACALALQLGKTPVVTSDVAGFLVNRILGPYLDEALRLFAGGLHPMRLDKLLKDFGMPMGPLRLLDEVGFDIASHAAGSLHKAYGERMEPSTGLTKLMSPKRLGKKSGKGFYDHPRGRGQKPTLCNDLALFQESTGAQALSDQAILDRCLFAMLNEAVRCLDEEVVESAQALDLATVFGTGFAPFRGGLLRWADSVGLQDVMARLNALTVADDIKGRPGRVERFTPAAGIERLAKGGGGFHL